MHNLIRRGSVLIVGLLILWELVKRKWPGFLPSPTWAPPSRIRLWAGAIGLGIWELLFLMGMFLLPLAVFKEFRANGGEVERHQVRLDLLYVIAMYLCIIIWFFFGHVGNRM
jgi:hypothetical protein